MVIVVRKGFGASPFSLAVLGQRASASFFIGPNLLTLLVFK
jgi:hypothetical protein